MILKEAFRYQNFYNELIDSCTSYLSMPSNITNRVQTHLRSATNKDAENETFTMPKFTTFENPDVKPNTVVRLLMDLYDQKSRLTSAISTAKSNASIDIDSEISTNKTRQKIASIFTRMARTQSRENDTTGTGKKFNGEGNQVDYTYDVHEVVTIDFDRNMVKAMAKKLNEESDRSSAAVDMANITVEVNFTPKYELDDTFEDCLEKILSENK